MISAVGNRMTREIARQKKLSDQLDKLQTQISGGKKLLRGSDDPVAARRIATIGKMQTSSAIWSANIKTASAQVSQADNTLGSVSNLLARARELSLSAANATTNPADRAVIAAELTGIANQIDGLAATRDSNGDPLFSAGNAKLVRFDAENAFAPVPSAGDAFVVGGNGVATGVRDAATAIANGDTTALGAALDTLTASISHIADQRAAMGLSAGRLERIDDSLAARDIMLAEERSSVEDTDLSVAIAQLQAQNLTLEAAQAAFARINRQTLFDLLR